MLRTLVGEIKLNNVPENNHLRLQLDVLENFVIVIEGPQAFEMTWIRAIVWCKVLSTDAQAKQMPPQRDPSVNLIKPYIIHHLSLFSL